MLRRRLLVLCLMAASVAALPARASETAAEKAADAYAKQEIAAAPPLGNLPDYSLPPDKLATSQEKFTKQMTLDFVTTGWGLVSLVLLLWLGVVKWMGRRSVPVGQVRWLQLMMYAYTFLVFTVLIALLPVALIEVLAPLRFRGILILIVLLASAGLLWTKRGSLRAHTSSWVEGYSFLLLWLVVGSLLSLPFDLYSQHLLRHYGISVQSWASWAADQGKSLLIGWLVGGLVFMLLFWVIRKLPRTWWLAFWVLTWPILLAVTFVGPYVNYAFNHYEPLQKSNPELVAKLEQVCAKAHMDIPPSRMYLQKASEKLTTLNADVEGFGASKRVVVWDNSIAKATPDEILMIFGHESGHYVLHHIERAIPLAEALLFVDLLVGYWFVNWAIRRFGAKWGIANQQEWGAFAVLMLAFSVLSLMSQPMTAGYSRGLEHAADIYGEEVIHGLVADPQASTKNAFDLLGTIGMSEPNPTPFYVWWSYGHPAIGYRAAFGKAYDPWAPGMEPKYFKKQ